MSSRQILGKRRRERDNAVGPRRFGLRPRGLTGKVDTYTYHIFDLMKYPPEVRLEIFRYCLERVDGQTPALVIALRGNKKSYAEALSVYYSEVNNNFHLSWDVSESSKIPRWYKKMLPEIKTMITSEVSLKLPRFDCYTGLILNNDRAELQVMAQEKALAHLPNIRVLTLYIPNNLSFYYSTFEVILKTGIQKQVKKLSIFIGNEGDSLLSRPRQMQYTAKRKIAVEHISRWLEVEPKRFIIVNSRGQKLYRSYVWEAGTSRFDFLKVGPGN